MFYIFSEDLCSFWNGSHWCPSDQPQNFNLSAIYTEIEARKVIVAMDDHQRRKYEPKLVTINFLIANDIAMKQAVREAINHYLKELFIKAMV